MAPAVDGRDVDQRNPAVRVRLQFEEARPLTRTHRRWFGRGRVRALLEAGEARPSAVAAADDGRLVAVGRIHHLPAEPCP